MDRGTHHGETVMSAGPLYFVFTGWHPRAMVVGIWPWWL